MDTSELGAWYNPTPDEKEEVENEVTFVVEYKEKITFPKEYTKEEKLEILTQNFREHLENGYLIDIDIN